MRFISVDSCEEPSTRSNSIEVVGAVENPYTSLPCIGGRQGLWHRLFLFVFAFFYTALFLIIRIFFADVSLSSRNSKIVPFYFSSNQRA